MELCVKLSNHSFVLPPIAEYSKPMGSNATELLRPVRPLPEKPEVAERALFLWNNDHIVSLVAYNRHVILPLIFPALERNTRNHWNQAVLNLTVNMKKMFSEMDNELVLSCQGIFDEEEAKVRTEAEKRKVIWERLETVANAQPVTENTAVLVTPTTSISAC